MIQQEFVQLVVDKIHNFPGILGIAAGGSWITNEIDEYSDVDLIVVSHQKISGDTSNMKDIASRFGYLLNSFTGEHVGDPRVLICLYDNPLLHVDIKFITLEEFKVRVEDPVVLWEIDNILTGVINSTTSEWPKLDYQWIEDRFWTWIHYSALKLGRGEFFEALDFISFLRATVVAPLLQIKNGQLPRGLRRVEQKFTQEDLIALKQTITDGSSSSIFNAIEQLIKIYRVLRNELFNNQVNFQDGTEQKCVEYFYEIKKQFEPNH